LTRQWWTIQDNKCFVQIVYKQALCEEKGTSAIIMFVFFKENKNRFIGKVQFKLIKSVNHRSGIQYHGNSWITQNEQFIKEIVHIYTRLTYTIHFCASLRIHTSATLHTGTMWKMLLIHTSSHHICVASIWSFIINQSINQSINQNNIAALRLQRKLPALIKLHFILYVEIRKNFKYKVKLNN